MRRPASLQHVPRSDEWNAEPPGMSPWERQREGKESLRVFVPLRTTPDANTLLWQAPVGDRMSDEQGRDPPEVLIDLRWRIVLVLLGIALLVAATLAWWKPPTKVEFAPQATSTADATTNVEDRSETTTGLLIGLGVLCVVIAANGRKLTSVKIAGQEITTDVAETVGEARGRARERGLAEGLEPAAADVAAELAAAQVYALASHADLSGLDLDAVAKSAVERTKEFPA